MEMKDEVGLLGELEVELVDGQSNVTRRLATYPLRFLFTQNNGVAWCYAVNFGGGLVCGDVLAFEVRVLPHARLVLTTQSSTKVYTSRPSYGGVPGFGNGAQRNVVLTEQRVVATVSEGSLLCVAPDPVTCFKGSRFHQTQRFELKGGANLCLVDWVSCGRQNGFEEVWEMEYFSNSIQVFYMGSPIFLEDIILQQQGPVDDSQDRGSNANRIKRRMGKSNVFATVVLFGPLLEAHAKLQAQIPATSTEGADVVVARARMLDDNGTIVRLAGPDVESIGRMLRAMFAGLDDLFGDALFPPK